MRCNRAGTFKLSQDPLFSEKVRDIAGCSLHPPDTALALCVDEQRQGQALQPTAALVPLRPGQVERRTHDYTRHGTTMWVAALDAKGGEVVGESQGRHRAKEFSRFLNLVDADAPPDLGVQLLLDNDGTHKAATIQRWLAAHPRDHDADRRRAGRARRRTSRTEQAARWPTPAAPSRRVSASVVEAGTGPSALLSHGPPVCTLGVIPRHSRMF